MKVKIETVWEMREQDYPKWIEELARKGLQVNAKKLIQNGIWMCRVEQANRRATMTWRIIER